ncbi:hypothetical protein, partial [Mycobacterium tuberculosis]
MGKQWKKKGKATISLVIVSAFFVSLFSNLQAFAYDTGASVSASYTFFMDQVGDVNDGIVNYGSSEGNRWTSYESPNASDWVQIDFGSAVTRSSVDVYVY